MEGRICELLVTFLGVFGFELFGNFGHLEWEETGVFGEETEDMFTFFFMWLNGVLPGLEFSSENFDRWDSFDAARGVLFLTGVDMGLKQNG